MSTLLIVAAAVCFLAGALALFGKIVSLSPWHAVGVLAVGFLLRVLAMLVGGTRRVAADV